MRRILLPVLVLIAASALTALPVVAGSDKDGRRIGVVVWNSDTVTSSDARYCLMPETMPIRPGNLVRLQDASGHELAVTAFVDIVAESIGTGDFQPSEPCQVYAVFYPVVPQVGLRLVFTLDPASQNSASPEGFTVSPGVQSFAYDWWYSEQGTKDCRFLGDVQLGEGSSIRIHPPAHLSSGGADTRTPQLQSAVSFSAWDGAENCTLATRLEFPLVDDYVIQFGGEAQAEDAD